MAMKLDTTVPVLIFKAGHYPLHHGTLGTIRSLGRLGVPVHAVVEDRFVPVVASRYLTSAFVWKTAGLDAATLLAGLAEISARIRAESILLPTDDAAAAFIAEHASVVRKLFRIPLVKQDLPRRLANKRDLHSLCTSIAVPCPAVTFPDSLAQVHAFLEVATFPVVVKAADPQRLPSGVRRTSFARNAEELLAIYRKAQNRDAPNLVFQEYIPSACAEDWIFHGYCNPQTDCFVGYTGRKLRSFPPFAGPTTFGVSLANEVLWEQTKALLRTLEYAGIMDLDYRLDKRDGQYKLLDFNPRLGANFRMFEDAEGLDVVRALHLDLTGRALPPISTMKCRKFVDESRDPFATLGYIRSGELTPRAWWQSWKGEKEIAWLHWDDSKPAFVLCMRVALRVFGRVMRKMKTSLRPGWFDKPPETIATTVETKSQSARSAQ